MRGKIDVPGKRVSAVISGGNVDINMLARVVERGLTQEGRSFSLTVGLDDKPGQLAMLSALLSQADANVLSVAHHRFGIARPVGRVWSSCCSECATAVIRARNRDSAHPRGETVREIALPSGGHSVQTAQTFERALDTPPTRRCAEPSGRDRLVSMSCKARSAG